MYAAVLIMNPISTKELILTYAIREGQVCLPGMLFSVNVRGKTEEGLILRLQKNRSGTYAIRELGEALYPWPMAGRRSLALARWLARYYVCPLPRAAALFLPPALRPVEETRYYMEAREDNAGSGEAFLINPVWQSLWDGLEKAGARGMSAQRMRQRWGGDAAAQAEEWTRSGWLRKETGYRTIRKKPRDQALEGMMQAELSAGLSPDQEKAYAQAAGDILGGRAGKHLLFGVTGSGKTEVYLRLALLARDIGKQTIYLIPEISLAPQLTAKARLWFPGQVAVLHSNLTASQRYTEWQRIRNGEAVLIIGPRSALFAPVDNLGLIVIDEEHEHTYKQSEPEPRYDARKTAETLARLWKATVVRGSATPDVESLYRVDNGELTLSLLPDRIVRRPMPPIRWIDMRREMKEGHPYPVSRALTEALQDKKAKGEQAILLMNRRGFHTYVLCRDCGKSMECPHCSIPLTYHRSQGGADGGYGRGHRLLCHYCGYQSALWDACPQCGGRILQYMGTGTQRVTDYLEKTLPELNLLRLDMDSTSRAGSHTEILKAFQEGKADVLVGTQMVAKGFDFPRVTLSAVLHIDGVVNLPDYQGAERAIQLILQTAGRAGRGESPGQVMVQTFNPDSPVLKLAGAYDYMAFYRSELSLRRALDYPPVKKSARILVTGYRDEEVEERLNELSAYCRERLPEPYGKEIIWLGPVKAPVEKIKNRRRRHLILLADSWAPLARCLELARSKASAWGDEPRLILDMEPKSYL